MLGGGRPSQRAPGDTLTCSRSVHTIASGASAPPLLNLSAVSEQRRRGEQRREAQPGPRGRRRPEHLSARAAARSVRSGTSSSAERPPPPGSSSSFPPPPPQRAPPPASRPSPAAGAESPRLSGVRGSPPSALGPTTRGRRRLIPRTAGERRASGRGRAAAPRAGAGRLRLGPASGGSHALAGDGAAPRPGAGPWPPEARRAPSGYGADTGWVERSRAAAGGAGRPAAPTREWASPGGGV